MSSNKTIAKNTVMLYIRMLISMLVGLYTSRVVLQTLGVEDYGIYGVVGGVVSMMGFINASMSGATSRFITFELGRGNLQRVIDTFSSALIIHIGIALVVVLLAETIGLWFLCNKLVIPEGRMEAAHWVYQCSIISAAIGVTQAPYSAVIMSHEKMDIYAYFELLNVGLKLAIVYLLLIGNFDKLILYSFLSLAVSIFMRMLYRIYCIKHYEESHFNFVWKKDILKPMLQFSGWDLYGNMCVASRQQGNSFLINMFFGVALNAAAGIASTVNGLILGLTGNVTQAFRPQIIKYYAQRNFCQMQKLMNSSAIYVIVLYSCMLIPALAEMPLVMRVWLGEVPQYAANFCRISLISGLIGLLNSTITIGIHSTGKIKLLSLITGSYYLFSLPISYYILKNGVGPLSTYIVTLFVNVLILSTDMIILKRLIHEFCCKIFLFTIIKGLFVLIICSVPSLLIIYAQEDSVWRLCVLILVNVISFSIATYVCILNAVQRKYFWMRLNGLIKK